MPHKDITQRRAYQKQYRARCRLSRADQRHCVVGDCRRTDSLRRGMCDLHYKRWWKHGDPLYEQPRLTIAERLVKYSDRSGGEDSCWLWTGGTITGYGVIKITHRNVFAHRASWELAHGPIPDGLFVLHNCPGGDNRACINPRHLFLGTDQDNYHDRVRKGGAPLKPTPSEYALEHFLPKVVLYVPKRLLTIIVEDASVAEVVAALISINQTGQPGDGKIFVSPIEEATRIRTGEVGVEAVA
jgi:nitrogen regulatory protein PII